MQWSNRRFRPSHGGGETVNRPNILQLIILDIALFLIAGLVVLVWQATTLDSTETGRRPIDSDGRIRSLATGTTKVEGTVHRGYDSEPWPVDGYIPIAIDIEDIGLLRTRIVAGGVNADGALSVSRQDVTWYERGPAPGEPGGVLLAAHFAYDNSDGPFRNLYNLRIGATVLVQTAEGVELEYVVEASSLMKKVNLSVMDLIRDNSTQRLILVTCGGEFNPDARQYDSNIVLTAKRTR